MKPIPGFEGSYSIEEDGSVWSHLSNSWRVHGIIQSGYHTISLRSEGYQITEYVHHLVLRTFVSPRPEGMWGLHKDDDRSNNHLSNLYWGTPSQNLQDALRNGIVRVGSRNHMSKITEEDVLHIRAAYAQGDSQNLIGIEFKLAQATVSNIVNRNTWKHVQDIESVRPQGLSRALINAVGDNRSLTEDQVREIRLRYSQGESQTDLALKYNVHQTSISNLVKGKTYGHVL